MTTPADVSAEQFSECLNETFTISRDDAQFEARLIDVRRLGGHATRADQQPFSILFHASDAVNLPQNTYRADHAAIGELDLFLVPVGPDPDHGGMCFEAVFT